MELVKIDVLDLIEEFLKNKDVINVKKSIKLMFIIGIKKENQRYLEEISQKYIKSNLINELNIQFTFFYINFKDVAFEFKFINKNKFIFLK